MRYVLRVDEPVTSGKVVRFYLLPLCPATLLSAPFLVWRLGLSPRWWEEFWPTVKLGMLSGGARFGLTWRAGMLLRLLRAQVRAVLGLQPLWPGTQLLRSPAGGRRAARPLQPALQLLATGGGEQTSTCCLSRHHLSTLAPQGSAAPTRAQKVQHAGSLGRARRLAQRPG